MNQTGTCFTPKWFRTRLSAVYRHIEYYAGVRWGWRDPLLPPDWLDPGGRRERFRVTGEEFFQYFVELCGLMPHERVLDVGCGTGRMARSLTRYLTGGSYDGSTLAPRPSDGVRRLTTLVIRTSASTSPIYITRSITRPGGVRRPNTASRSRLHRSISSSSHRSLRIC